jgi:hypothetical protein
MAQSSASASEMRETEDDKRLASDSEKQAGIGQASRHSKGKQKAAPRLPPKRMEAQAIGKVGETLLWEWRCEQLGFNNWTRRLGPAEGFIMAKLLADAIDHDEARIMAFGGKKYELELRISGRNAKSRRFEIGGYPLYKYTAFEVRKPAVA